MKTLVKQSFSDRVISLIEAARAKTVAAVNLAMVYTYYEVGRMIVDPTFHVRNESPRFARAFVRFLELSNKGLHYTPADAVCAASELTFGGGCAGSVSPSWFKRILTSSFGST